MSWLSHIEARRLFNGRWLRFLGWLCLGGVFFVVGYSAYHSRWNECVGASVFVVAGLVYMCGRWRVSPVWDVLTMTSLFLNAMGWVWEYYHTVWFYDELTHTLMSVPLTAFVAFILIASPRSLALQLKNLRVITVIVLLSMGLAALWEIGEWIAYLYTRNDGIIKSLGDTITDMMFHFLGALLSLPLIKSLPPPTQ